MLLTKSNLWIPVQFESIELFTAIVFPDTNASPFDDANRRVDHDRDIFSSSFSSFSRPALPPTVARDECMRVYRRTMQTELASQCAAAAAGKLGKQLCEQCERAATSFTLPRHLVALVPLHFLHFVLCPSQSPAGIMRPAWQRLHRGYGYERGREAAYSSAEKKPVVSRKA